MLFKRCVVYVLLAFINLEITTMTLIKGKGYAIVQLTLVWFISSLNLHYVNIVSIT